jgi:hypothetical protein
MSLPRFLGKELFKVKEQKEVPVNDRSAHVPPALAPLPLSLYQSLRIATLYQIRNLSFEPSPQSLRPQ